MTTILGLLGSAWPYVLAGLTAAGSLLFAWAAKKSAATQVAQAGQQVAQAQTNEQTAKTQTATVRDGEAQANATAALAGANNAQERANVENDVSSLPTGVAAVQLRDDWTTGTGTTAAAAGSAGQDPGH